MKHNRFLDTNLDFVTLGGHREPKEEPEEGKTLTPDQILTPVSGKVTSNMSDVPPDGKSSTDNITKGLTPDQKRIHWESYKGGEGSGNFGHEGRPGEVGGSGGGGGGKPSGEAWANSLSEVHTDSIINWQTNENCAAIRDAQIRGKETSESRLLDSALNSDGSYEGTTYRGLNELDDDAYNSIINSEELTLKAHSSASKDRDVATNFAESHIKGRKSVLFRIKGKTGVDISVIKGSGFEDQAEVILKKGTKYKVGGTSQLGKITVVQLSEL